MEVENVSFRFVRKIKAKERGFCKYKFSQKTELAKELYPGLAKGEFAIRDMEISLEDVQKKNKAKILKDKEKAELSAEEILMIELLAPSIQTELISCVYYLEVKPVYGYFEKMKGTPILKLPLVMKSEMFHDHVTVAPQQPDDWNPTMCESLPLNFHYEIPEHYSHKMRESGIYQEVAQEEESKG